MNTIVGFCGGRSLAGEWSKIIRPVVQAVVANGRGVAVGCADGADKMVRDVTPDATVFRAIDYGSGKYGLVARSQAMVKGSGSVVGFVAGECPGGIIPGTSWSSGDKPSGTWSSLALAAGRGLPVVVFWCDDNTIALPTWPGGEWVQAGNGVWSHGWRWSPTIVQASLF